jgi:hypothetical protein
MMASHAIFVHAKFHDCATDTAAGICKHLVGIKRSIGMNWIADDWGKHSKLEEIL